MSATRVFVRFPDVKRVTLPATTRPHRRHSDHHMHAGRRYPLLRLPDEAPLLPLGYPSMMLLGLLPPLFFALVHPRLDALRRGRGSSRLAPPPSVRAQKGAHD